MNQKDISTMSKFELKVELKRLRKDLENNPGLIDKLSIENSISKIEKRLDEINSEHPEAIASIPVEFWEGNFQFSEDPAPAIDNMIKSISKKWIDKAIGSDGKCNEQLYKGLHNDILKVAGRVVNGVLDEKLIKALEILTSSKSTKENTES